MENSERDGNTRSFDLSLERSVCQEATVRTGHGTTDWFQIGSGLRQGCILSPCLFNLHADYIMGNAGLVEAQAGIKIARRNINNLRYADDTTLMAESESEVAQSCLFATPWTVVYQAPPSMGFSRQECWSGLTFPSPGDLPDPGIEPRSPALQADALPSEPPGKPAAAAKSL